jgi:hypothetical protein
MTMTNPRTRVQNSKSENSQGTSVTAPDDRSGKEYLAYDPSAAMATPKTSGSPPIASFSSPPKDLGDPYSEGVPSFQNRDFATSVARLDKAQQDARNSAMERQMTPPVRPSRSKGRYP